jgi:hypothetical protein
MVYVAIAAVLAITLAALCVQRAAVSRASAFKRAHKPLGANDTVEAPATADKTQQEAIQAGDLAMQISRLSAAIGNMHIEPPSGDFASRIRRSLEDKPKSPPPGGRRITHVFTQK